MLVIRKFINIPVLPLFLDTWKDIHLCSPETRYNCIIHFDQCHGDISTFCHAGQKLSKSVWALSPSLAVMMTSHAPDQLGVQD